MEDYLEELDNRNADDTMSGGITSVPAYRNTVKRFQNWVGQNCPYEEDDEDGTWELDENGYPINNDSTRNIH
jgi:hypothetical protein